MKYTKKQKEIVGQLESLVHRRFSKERLVEAVNKIFGVKDTITIQWEYYDDLGLSDWNAVFTTHGTNIMDELQGDFDIFYLKSKQPNEDGAEVYVTEVGVEFC